MLLVTHTCDPSYVGGGRGSHELEANYMVRLSQNNDQTTRFPKPQFEWRKQIWTHGLDTLSKTSRTELWWGLRSRTQYNRKTIHSRTCLWVLCHLEHPPHSLYSSLCFGFSLHLVGSYNNSRSPNRHPLSN